MSLEKASIMWNNRQLSGMVKNGKVNFDHIVQRSYVWETSRKSAFIESQILGYPIPPVYAKRIDDGTGKRGGNIYYIMDGKQRLSTIKEYLCDEFALTSLPPVTYFDEELDKECEVNITNKKFSELPVALQTLLNTVSVNVTYFDNLTTEEERELFKRLNAGKPLSTKSRLLASCKDIHGLLNIGSHKLFDEMMTAKSRNNKNQVAVVMKCWCMMNQSINDVCFESKVFNPLLEKITISETEKLALAEVFNMIVETHNILIERNMKKVAKKLYTETHMVSLIPYFKKSIENGISAELMADWLISFFDTKEGATVSNLYNEAAGSGSAKSSNIIDRDDALSESYTEFFKADEETDELIDETIDEMIDEEEEFEANEENFDEEDSDNEDLSA